MAFKIKDGVRVGSKDVLNNSGQLLTPIINGNVTSHDGNDIAILDAAVIREAANQDGVRLQGRAGGTSNYTVTLTPGTLTTNRIITLPDKAGTVALTSDLPVDTNTTYSLSTLAGDTIYDEKIRLTGSDASTDDIKLAVGAVDAVYGLTIEQGSDTITFKHADTSSAANLTATARTYVTGLTFDPYGHVTGYTTGTETLVNSDLLQNVTADVGATERFIHFVNSASGAQEAGSSTKLKYVPSTGKLTIGNELYSADTTVALLDTTTTTINFGRAATSIIIGAATGTTNVRNSADIDGDLNVDGGDLTTGAATFNLINATATTVNFAGAATALTIGATSGNTTIRNNLSITGNLTVNGTTTTVNSTVTTVDDPVITLGGDAAPASDDNKDRGIEFRWHNGTVAKLGFFGFDDSTGKFTFIPDATNTSEVFSGTTGEIDAKIDWNNILNKPVDANTTYAISTEPGADAYSEKIRLTGSDAVTDDVILAVGAVDGVYGLTIEEVNDTITFKHADTSGATNLTGVANTFVNGLTFDTYGHVTGYTTSTAVISDVLQNVSADTTNADRFIHFVNNATGAQEAGSSTKLKYNPNTGVLKLDGSVQLSAISEKSAKSTTVATANVATEIDSWAKATYRVAKYIITVTQGTFYQTSELTVFNDGTTAGQFTETHVFSTAAASEATFSIDASGANMILKAVMPTATSTTYKIDRTLIVI